MVVTDDQADALRALCLQDRATFQAMLEKVEAERNRPESLVFANLIGSALIIAVERRFEGKPESEIIRFIADVRSLNDQAATAFDPQASEAVIRFTLEQIDDTGLDGKTRFGVTLGVVMALLAGPYRLPELTDRSEVDKFVAEARQLTDEGYAAREAAGRPIDGH